MSTQQQSRAEKTIHTAWLNVKGYADKVLAVLTSASGTVWGIQMQPAASGAQPLSWLLKMPDAAVPWFWATVSFAFFWAVAAFVLQRPRYAELSRELDQATQSTQDRAGALEAALKSLLRQLASYCNVDGNDFRTSLYYFHAGQFIAVARYSKHPDHAVFRDGKSHHGSDQGAIGEAWRGTEYYKADLPATRAIWETKMCELFGYLPRQVGRFRMQSRSYEAIRIDGHDGAVGVLVFESTLPFGVTKDAITNAKGSLIKVALAEMVTTHAALTPQIEMADASAEPRKNKDSAATKSRPWKSAGRAGAQLELANL